jgi:hypothetical protein
VVSPAGAKARSIREVLTVVAEELGVPVGSVVPVSLAADREAYNVEALRLRISEALPAARHAQLSRAYADDRRGGWWKEVGRLYQGVRTIMVD